MVFEHLILNFKILTYADATRWYYGTKASLSDIPAIHRPIGGFEHCLLYISNVSPVLRRRGYGFRCRVIRLIRSADEASPLNVICFVQKISIQYFHLAAQERHGHAHSGYLLGERCSRGPQNPTRCSALPYLSLISEAKLKEETAHAISQYSPSKLCKMD